MKLFEAFFQQLETHGIVTLHIRVHPGARKTCMRGVMDDGAIKIDVAAAPEEGRANAKLVEFLADGFGVAKGNIEIVSGETGRRKTVRISR